MTRAILTITILALLTLLGSCCHQAAVVADHSSLHEVHDTTIIHDDGGPLYVPYAVPGDTLRVSIPVDCDSLGKVTAAQLSSHGHRIAVYTDLGEYNGHQQISVQAICAELADSLAVKQRTIEHIIHERDSIATDTRQTVMVQYVPGFYQWSTWALWILLALALIGGALYLYFKATKI